MRDVVITGSALVQPALTDGNKPHARAANEDLRPAAWAGAAAKLARMDRLCALALVAADGALVAAGWSAPAPREAALFAVEGERVAVVVGTALGCAATNEAFYGQGRGWQGGEGGAAQASPRLFAYTLPSSPLGEITIHLAARGPAETLATGRAAGLQAIAEAARLVRTGRASIAIAVAVDAGAPSLEAIGLRVRDGAAAVVLEEAAEATARGARVLGRLRGEGESFGDSSTAIARAAAHASATHAPGATLVVEEGDDAVAPVAALVAWLAGGARALALVGAAGSSTGGAAAAALVVERRPHASGDAGPFDREEGPRG